MRTFTSEQNIRQLEDRKGGYFYLEILAEVVQQFDKRLNGQHPTRFLCTLDNAVTYRCGLNHLGDGNFFIIIASKHLKALGKSIGDIINYTIEIDPNPLGVELPEVLEVLFAQDDTAREAFERLTDGKKRSLIHTIMRLKDVDKQVQTALTFLHESQNTTRQRQKQKKYIER
jgi:hypothetical protein